MRLQKQQQRLTIIKNLMSFGEKTMFKPLELKTIRWKR